MTLELEMLLGATKRLPGIVLGAGIESEIRSPYFNGITPLAAAQHPALIVQDPIPGGAKQIQKQRA